LTATLFLSIFRAAEGLGSACVGCAFCSLLLLVAFIDIDTMEIHDSIALGGMVGGVLLSIIPPDLHWERLRFSPIIDSLIGACFGSGLMYWIATLGEMAFKREAVGGGDVKLMGMIGSFIGSEGSVFAIFGGSFITTIISLPAALVLKIILREKFKIPREVPFAPFIAIGAIAYVLFGKEIIAMLL
jgi:leader peptidase (prepilin peptidase)/N-methyltransferase